MGSGRWTSLFSFDASRRSITELGWAWWVGMIDCVMVTMLALVGAPVALMAAALVLAAHATFALRRNQAANDHDRPLITPLYRTQMRWAAGLLAAALLALIGGRFAG